MIVDDYVTMLFNVLQEHCFEYARSMMSGAFTSPDMVSCPDRNHSTAVVDGRFILSEECTVAILEWSHCLHSLLQLAAEANVRAFEMIQV